MLCYAIGLLAGICFALFYVPSAPFGSNVALTAATLIVSCLTFKHNHWRGLLLKFIVAGILGAVVAGVQIMVRQNDVLLPNQVGVPLVFEGQVIESFRGGVLLQRQDPRYWTPTAKIKLFSKENIQTGQSIRGVLKLKPPHGLLNPGGEDIERYTFSRNIIANAQFAGQPLITGHPQQNIKTKIIDKVRSVLDNDTSRGVLLALTLGYKDNIPSTQWQVFAQTGTSHLLAISGLHVATIAGFFFAIILWCVKRSQRLCHCWPAQCWAAIGSLPFVYTYAWISGFALPTQRAVIMLTLAMLALATKQRVLSLSTWSLALIMVCLWDPLAPLQKGFWLSFGCVAALMASQKLKLRSKWQQILIPQLLLFTLLIPISVFFFGGFSLISPVANLIAIPVVTLIVLPVSLIGVSLVNVIPPLGEIALNISATTFEWLFTLLEWLNAIPNQFLIFSSPSWWTVALATAAIAWVWLGQNKAKWIGLVVCAPLLMSNSIAVGDLRITFLEVGQGLAVVLQTHQHTMLFDAGPSMGSSNAGERIILPFMRSQGIKQFDQVMISHADDDHAGGLLAVMNKTQSVTTSQPHLLAKKGLVATACQQGQKWEWDNVMFEVLAPHKNYQGKTNAGSCVLRVTSHDKAVLLTGDIDKKAEKQLLENDLESVILQVPHHGSKTSSSSAFVKSTHPQYAIFSVGAYNRFGFPKQEVVNQYLECGSQCLNTTLGAIRCDLAANHVECVAYRAQNKKIWHAFE